MKLNKRFIRSRTQAVAVGFMLTTIASALTAPATNTFAFMYAVISSALNTGIIVSRPSPIDPMMQSNVFALRHHLEIRRNIVGSILINVVNMFRGQQWSTENLFHNGAVLKNESAMPIPQLDVPVTVDRARFSFASTLAVSTTKSFVRAGATTMKRRAALLARVHIFGRLGLHWICPPQQDNEGVAPGSVRADARFSRASIIPQIQGIPLIGGTA